VVWKHQCYRRPFTEYIKLRHRDHVMNEYELRQLLAGVRTGHLDPEQAADTIAAAMREAPYDDLGFARLDTHRAWRQGFPEVVLGLGKTPSQIGLLAERIAGNGHTLLVTRATPEAYAAVLERVPGATYHEVARAISHKQGEIPAGTGTVLVACAGTSDLPVAEEAAVTAAVMGNTVDRLNDVGVAGIHRLIREQSRLQSARVVIVVAGMEGALPSVVAGLVKVPVIAVPTSIGYGASFQGLAPLLGMLNSCANGVAVVNIDNGFGAACVASAINHL
jgi:NCAIR mutase (PurE)-related protein